MQGRKTDHRNISLAKLHTDVIRGNSNGQIIWQPRIGCWLGDKIFAGIKLPEPFDGMSLLEIYQELGCSARLYEYSYSYKRTDDPRVTRYSSKISEMETEYVTETPAGRISQIGLKTPNSSREIKKKWLITSEEDIKVAIWMEERCTWSFDEEVFQNVKEKWGDLGAPTMLMPRVNIQHLYINVMGVENTVYALYDYPETVEKYFRVLDESHERLIQVINRSPIDIINFGDNLHCGTLPPDLFKKYIIPTYQKRNELLHAAGKFTNSHWDGDTRAILPFAQECGLDGIEAITPKPQGDVTPEEAREAMGDRMFLLDGLAAILFDDMYPEEMLIEQTQKVIELFAPRLILGISDEMSSTGNIERIRLVGKIVDDYNASVKSAIPEHNSSSYCD